MVRIGNQVTFIKSATAYRDFPETDLPHLLRLILENSSIPRIRISSLEPMDSPDRIIEMTRKNEKNLFIVKLRISA